MKEYEQRATKIIMNTVEGVKAQIRKAYNKGYEDGKADTPFTDTEEAEKKAYDRGLSDAWEVASKLVHPRLGGYTEEQKQRIFGYVSSDSILQNFTASEALAKIKAYEDKQKQDAEIKVGDEVRGEFGNKGIVITNVPSPLGDVSVWFSNQTHVQLYPVKNLSKTGRHFDQIAEVLAELRGAENDE